MGLNWNEIKSRALQFSKTWADACNENSQAKPFWIKVVNQNVYEDLLFGKIPFTTLCAQLRFTQLNEEGKNKVPLDRLINWVRFSMLSESEYHEVDQNDPIRKYDEKLWNYDVERKRLLPIFCQKLSMFNVN